MVMVCVPFSFIGSLLILSLTGSSINMTSLLGFLMLIGTVVNNGILYVDTVNTYKLTMSREDALVQAGVTRLRPILMTSLTTTLSLAPLAIGIGQNAEMMPGLRHRRYRRHAGLHHPGAFAPAHLLHGHGQKETHPRPLPPAPIFELPPAQKNERRHLQQ